MKAEPLLEERHVLDEDAFVEVVIWQVPRPVRGSGHAFKYRLALVMQRICVLRYDNEAGKGDHRHCGDVEAPYAFSDFPTLLADFWSDVNRVRTAR